VANILFADDDFAMRQMVADILKAAGHSVRVVSGGKAALKEFDEAPPDLALLDYRMGDPDGFEVCRRIKEDPRFAHLPILMVTGEGDIEDRINGFAAGASDYVPKPFDARELLARVNAHLRLSEQARGLNPTTGLPGGMLIDREFERRRAAGAPFSLCYLDLDHFKAFNDRFGFATANQVIEQVGAELRITTRGTAHFVGHIGGDDFILICDTEFARQLVEETQQRLKHTLAQVLPPQIAQQGRYLGKLRSGREALVPLTRFTAVLLHLHPRNIPTLEELGRIAASAKEQAKAGEDSGLIEMTIGS
jgi:PleD family two-component response regulator